MISLDVLGAVRAVALAFGDLSQDIVFVGGAATGFLVTDPAAAEQRTTADVDVIVRIASYADWVDLGGRLRELGFIEDTTEGAPRCRFVVQGIKVDVMSWGQHPGPPSRWFEEAHHLAQAYAIAPDLTVRVITAPFFLAAKLEAFKDGRRDDVVASRDIEDIIAVVDGRDTIVSEVGSSPAQVRDYVAKEIGILLADRDFVDAVAGHLPGDSASQARLRIVMARLTALAGLA